MKRSTYIYIRYIYAGSRECEAKGTLKKKKKKFTNIEAHLLKGVNAPPRFDVASSPKCCEITGQENLGQFRLKYVNETS